MAGTDDDENFMDDVIGLDDYDIIPRPQEVIEQQKRASSSKGKQSRDKPVSSLFKRSSEVSKESKNKEKRSSSKHERKGSSKAKPLYKLPVSVNAPKKYPANELDSRFESFIQNAKSSMHKYKSESAKMAGNESSDIAETKSKSPDPDASKILNIQQSKLMEEPAVTPLERFKVLDARDTAIRLSRDVKQGDSKKTKIIGKCPDMCPEKERYSRIAKNCLSALEMTTALDPNATSRDANHSYMVKEYSRSSADQQEPLPHELRPIPVLMFTMDYLICNIMDLPLQNISLADWYDFIWNRTRSIRKDITQQQLCDLQCVEIIEKCVRFHIHCAEALSEEETAIFDPKINNENLTKCLQTLKHMYHDLQSKGMQCPNEAEFRSYDILLSLTEGETLRLVKDIRKDLLKSPVIKFAFNAALAFKSHNYVKFFKLIEKANYLCSCILHRYMLEARVRALQIIVRAYSTQQHSSSYPTASLVKDLKFECLSEAAEFCRCHGLEADDTFITIERKQFSKAASGLPTSRSFLLVGSKRGKSIGKIINKGVLPSNPLSWYQPHNSFDQRNILKVNSLGSFPVVAEAEQPKENLSFHVSSPSPFNKPMTPRNSSPFHAPKSESMNIFTTSFATSTTSKFSFVDKMSDPFAARKELPFSELPQPAVTKNILEVPKTEESHSPFRIPSFTTEFNRKPLDLPTTEEIFSFGKAPRAKTDTAAEFPEVEIENEIIMEDIQESSESSDEEMMAEGYEINEESSQLSLNTSVFQFNKTEENLGNFPFQQTSGPFQPPSKSTFEVLCTEEISPSRERLSPQHEKEIKYPDTKTAEGIVVSDFDEHSQSSIEENEKETEERNDEERLKSELNEIMEDLADDLFSECIQEHSLSICEEVMNEERSRIAKIEDELELIKTNLAIKTILKWRHFCERKRQRRMLQNSTFCSPWQPMLLNTPYVTTGVMTPIAAYRKHCSLSRLTAEKIKKSKEITSGWEEFKAEDIWPLKVFKPYPSAYLGKSGFKFFFKLCIVFPADSDNSDVTHLMNWICAKFSLHKTQASEHDAVNTWILHNGKMLICVRALQLGPQTRSTYVKFLHGITAMLLFLPLSSENNGFYEEFTYLLDSDTLQYSYPLFLYFLKSNETSSRLISFLQEKLDARYFTKFKTECLPEMNKYGENSKKVLDGLNWLIETERKDFSHPLLQKCSFINYVEDSFAFAFNVILCKISLDEFKCLKQMPHHIIDFYNKVLKFRSSSLCSDLMERIHCSWPPEDIKSYLGNKFIDIETQDKCKRKFNGMLLPGLEDESFHIDNVLKYVKQIGTSAGRDKDILFIRIKNALENSSSTTDWLSVLNLCALHLIHVQNSELLLLNEDISVYYTKEDLETFDGDEFWMDVLLDLRSISNLSCAKRKKDSALDSPLKRNKWEFTIRERSPPNVPLMKEESFISSAFDMPDIFSCQRENLLAPLRAAFAKQVEQSEAFFHQLNKSVKNADVSTSVLNEDENPQEMDFSCNEMPSAVGNANFYDFSSQSVFSNSSTKLNSDVDLLGLSICDSNRTSISSIANKISELKYNIQKSNILEDHFSELLSNELCED